MFFRFFTLLTCLMLTHHAQAYFQFALADDPGEGFYDMTPVEPVGNNPGDTIGLQRLFVFVEAARIIESHVKVHYPVLVVADFSPLYCSPTEAMLGAAG
ncbi:MAG: hypothetical protein VW274_06180, partial [Thalassolituus sp.]